MSANTATTLSLVSNKRLKLTTRWITQESDLESDYSMFAQSQVTKKRVTLIHDPPSSPLDGSLNPPTRRGFHYLERSTEQFWQVMELGEIIPEKVDNSISRKRRRQLQLAAVKVVGLAKASTTNILKWVTGDRLASNYCLLRDPRVHRGSSNDAPPTPPSAAATAAVATVSSTLQYEAVYEAESPFSISGSLTPLQSSNMLTELHKPCTVPSLSDVATSYCYSVQDDPIPTIELSLLPPLFPSIPPSPTLSP